MCNRNEHTQRYFIALLSCFVIEEYVSLTPKAGSFTPLVIGFVYRGLGVSPTTRLVLLTKRNN